jgi:NAD(P)-dependent dehydrogenase (short-subunit alcohol dehydrogenase family)
VSTTLDGRVALVTGASSGIGARFAAVLAGAGARVYACARRAERLEQLAAEHPGVVPVACDVAEAGDREAAVARALAEAGRLDICVNSAGTSAPGPAEDVTLEDFRRVMAVNVEGLFGMTQAAVRPMLDAGAGSVINVGSMFGQVASAPVPEAAYVASKSAVVGLTRELAAQWAPRGVRVNAIAPGWFPTEMTAELLADERSRHWLERTCPMGRPGRIDELDGVLLFLATDASTYCTGQTIVVDGGWTLK